MEAPSPSGQSAWAPVLTPAAPPVVTLIGANEKPTDRGLSLLLFAIRTRELSLIDTPLLTESAFELAGIARAELGAIRLDPTVLDDIRTFVQSADLSHLASAPARALRSLVTIRPRPRAQAPNASYPSHVKKIRITPIAPARSAAPRGPRRLPRVHFGRVLVKGLLVSALATFVMTMPPDVMEKLANRAETELGPALDAVGATLGDVSSALGETLGNVGSALGEKLAEAQAQPRSTLARATFELPPLSAYGAAFDSQAPYPTVRPNAMVEWVVALRNTGSVGWYRGIDGAQASLALADGTEVAVQTTPYVGPGQVGWFVVHFPAPSNIGTSNVKLLPRIDGRGALRDLGIYARVTVSPNP